MPGDRLALPNTRGEGLSALRTSVFVDTSAWYAAADSGDSSNSVAKELLSRGHQLVTSDHVLIETWWLLRSWLHRGAAEEFWEALRGGVADVESTSPADLQVAWMIGEEFPDHDFSIVDRTSFAVMRRLGIDRVVTFDADFAIYRYGERRRRAFQLLS